MTDRRIALLPLLLAVAFVFPSRTVAAQHPPCHTGCIAYQVSVFPQGTVVGKYLNSSHDTAVFTVTNTGADLDEYTLSCSASGGVSCTSVSNTDMPLAAGASDGDTVVYSVGMSIGNVTLTAVGELGSPQARGSGWYTVTAQPTITIVTPVATSGRAVVHNRQPILRALFGINGSLLDTTKTRLIWRTDTVSSFHAETLSVARQNRGLVEWEVDSLRGLGLPDSGLMTVKACAQNLLCTTVTEWVVLLGDHKPVLGFTGTPLEALGRQFSAPFGPGLSVSGPEVETGFTIPSYVSMNAARSAGLVYSTRQSYPRAVVPVDIELPWPSGTPTKVHITLLDGSTRLDSLVITSPSCLTGSVHRCRAVLQGDYSTTTFTTPTRKWLTVQVQVDSSTTTQLSTDSVEVVLVDRRTTPYGSGWWLSGYSKLVGAGSDRLLIGPTGTTSIYRGNSDSVYLAPPGDFSTLLRVGIGWELHARGTIAKVVFDSGGRLWKAIDQNGNVDSLHFNGSTDQVTAIVDRTGQKISVVYDGNGKINTFTDPGGRVSRDTVNGTTDQLTSDSLASDLSRPNKVAFSYQTYSGTGTVLLTKTIGVLGDTTVLTYDSTGGRPTSATRWWRPSQVTLPTVATDTNGSVKPVITYAPYPLQGWSSLVALTATIVQFTDPRTNWTRSWLNRWGEARATWDTLSVLSSTVLDSTVYSADGFVLRTQGKQGDSTRVFTDYDTQWRPVRSWRYRTAGHVYRADSLVYDSLSRVVDVLSPNGQTTESTYDGNGNVTEVAHLGFGGDATQYWYDTNGLLDSVSQSGNPPVRYAYDATTKNLTSTHDQSDTLIGLQFYDSEGRDTSAWQRQVVQVSGSTTAIQWRKTRSHLTADNLADTVVVSRTDDCVPSSGNEYCAWDGLTWPVDSLHTQHVSYGYDRGGRDTLRLNDRGNGPRYRYDRLGRVVARYPWASNTSIRDSLVYDIAGNVRKVITRRGDTLTTTFDSRNRDTLTAIPGVGNRRKQYTGYNDELTKTWYDSPVDAIGNVNARLAWTYDKHGRLVTDTTYNGSAAEGTGYAYDSLERVTTLTDARGAWTIGYETARGYVTLVTTPAGDTLSYSCNKFQQCSGPLVRNGGATRIARKQYWNVSNVLDSVLTTASVAETNYVVGKQYRAESQDNEDPFLLPVWKEGRDTLGTAHTFADSAAYDGWERLLSWFDKKDTSSSQTQSQGYVYDRTNNLTTLGTTHDSVDITTDRLAKRVTGTDTTWYSYDNGGNLVKSVHHTGGVADSTTYLYDALGQLLSVQYDTTLVARYGYDVSGRRIAKRVYNGATGGTVGYTHYVYHGGQVNFETDDSGHVGYQYTWGTDGADDIVAVDSGTNHYYPVVDRLGSVRGLVRKDGTWQWSTQYTPYGSVFAHDSAAGATPRLHYGWTGREFDAELGFYYLRARYYDPASGRFTQEDPVGYVGGTNLYEYANGVPLEGRDPNGTRWNPVSWRYVKLTNCWSINCDGAGLGAPSDAFSMDCSEWGSSAFWQACGGYDPTFFMNFMNGPGDGTWVCHGEYCSFIPPSLSTDQDAMANQAATFFGTGKIPPLTEGDSTVVAPHRAGFPDPTNWTCGNKENVIDPRCFVPTQSVLAGWFFPTPPSTQPSWPLPTPLCRGGGILPGMSDQHGWEQDMNSGGCY